MAANEFFLLEDYLGVVGQLAADEHAQARAMTGDYLSGNVRSMRWTQAARRARTLTSLNNGVVSGKRRRLHIRIDIPQQNDT